MTRLVALGLAAHAVMLLVPLAMLRSLDASSLLVVASAVCAAALEASAAPWTPSRARLEEGPRLRTWSAAASMVLGAATVHAAASARPGVGLVLGIALLVFGGLVRRAAIVQLGDGFRTEGGATALRTTGLYRHVRHPSELGLMLMSGGLVLVAPSYLACGLAMAQLGLLVVRLQIEEAALRRSFPGTYEAYARTTPPLVGFIRRPATCRIERVD